MYNIECFRPCFLALVTVLLISRVFVESQNQFTINGDTDKAMDEKYLLKTLAMAAGRTINYCLEQCLRDCLCLSFQICHKTECQLCSSNKYENSSALQSKQGCTNYVFETQRSEENNQQCDISSCTTLINCCMTSNPCLNGGTCLPRNNRQMKSRRFKCKCPDGYTGYRCEQPIRSCRRYSGGNRVAGKYKVFDDNVAPYEVFCDFDNNSSMTWTLIQSYKLSDRTDVAPLHYDRPLNQDTHSWSAIYRLSKKRMESIQEDSIKWRVTCQYEKQGCTDLIRGSNNKMDILTRKSGCYEVEYISVRDHSCSNCTVYFWQSNRYTLHFYSRKAADCYFPRHVGRNCGDYFGDYTCKDTAHCCSEKQTATTQIWFGGH